MTFHISPRKLPSVAAAESFYWTAASVPASPPSLRRLTALDQMYAYWGSDLT